MGEGNLSFTISLVKKLQLLLKLITSTYEGYSELSEYAEFNSKLLKQAGITPGIAKTLMRIEAAKEKVVLLPVNPTMLASLRATAKL